MGGLFRDYRRTLVLRVQKQPVTIDDVRAFMCWLDDFERDGNGWAVDPSISVNDFHRRMDERIASLAYGHYRLPPCITFASCNLRIENDPTNIHADTNAQDDVASEQRHDERRVLLRDDWRR